ncbi:hypothetical protein N7481_007109, partial [Penicillium waksmanii]|uniref:uncharacterized protein n=1 Tax=Penicillium waksmanii TaxID=69791 RepID=UPI002546B0BC
SALSSTPETVSMEDKGPTILAVMWSMTALALVLVVTRLCVRQRILRSFGLDDWLITFSMIFGLLFSATAAVSVVKGFGQHTASLSTHAAEQALLWNMISFIFGIVSFALPKLAVAALLHRILNPIRIHRIILWTLVSMITVIAIINILIYVTMCSPPQGLWKSTLVLEGVAKCRPVDVLIGFATFNGGQWTLANRLAYFANASFEIAFSAFVDLYLATYPAFILFHLQMSLRKKIALSAALGLGTIASAIAMVKCAQIGGLRDQTDLTYSTVPLVIWTSVEANIVVIAACMPTLKPVIDFILVKLKLTTLSDQKYQSNSFSQGRVYAKPAVERSNRQASQFKNISEENILGDQEDLQIRRTDEVYVGYELQPNAPANQNQGFT